MSTPDQTILKTPLPQPEIMIVSRWAWVLFAVLILAALAFDRGLLGRSPREQRPLSTRAAAIRSAAWIALAFIFGLGVMAFYGRDAGLAFITAYVLLLSDIVEFPNHVSLGVIPVALTLSVVASIKWPGPGVKAA